VETRKNKFNKTKRLTKQVYQWAYDYQWGITADKKGKKVQVHRGNRMAETDQAWGTVQTKKSLKCKHLSCTILTN
jgi:hypothetical protein